MKKMCAFLSVALLMCTAGFAQCDKDVVYHSDKQEIFAADGQLQDTKSDAISMTIIKEKMVLEVPDKGDALSATIKETDCQWKEVFKEGKVTYKAEFRKQQTGETSDGTILIEAKDGKLAIQVEIQAMNGRKVKLWVNKYEEK